MQCADYRIRTCETTIMALHLMHDRLQQACDCFVPQFDPQKGCSTHALCCGVVTIIINTICILDVLLYMAIYVDIAGGDAIDQKHECKFHGPAGENHT